MKFIDEYRDGKAVRKYAEMIAALTTREWTIMEICGGQTHSIIRFGVDQLLPEKITLVHGPGCPVCVTALETVDKAIEIAGQPDVILCSFGDMLRVPGSGKDLLTARSAGGDVRTVYSPLDALEIAQANPDKQVVFFAVGFETTAPGAAMAVYQARQKNVKNFSLLTAHVLVIPAMEAILSAPDNRVNGFLAAGHVCTVTGYNDYIPIAEKYKIPIVVTGFEPLDLMTGIYHCVKLLEEQKFVVENQYARAVRPEGNKTALQIISEVFTVCDRKWRGIGNIPDSGWKLSEQYTEFDAENRFDISSLSIEESPVCISGLILQGAKKPDQCPAFGTDCTPEHPLGATMVSSEGACAAYYRYRKD